MIKVFVYGTLKPGESNYQYYCQGKVVEEIRAYTWGELFALSLGYPAMIKGISKVHGYLLTFNTPDILTHLDQLEDYNPQRSPEENEYQRELITVYNLDDQPIEKVWAYLMLQERVAALNGVLIPSGWWKVIKWDDLGGDI